MLQFLNLSGRTIALTSALTIGLFQFGLSAAIAEVKLTTKSRLATNGIGPVLTGMTLKEAEKQSGLRFKTTASGNKSCRHVEPIGGVKDVSFMMNEGSQ